MGVNSIVLFIGGVVLGILASLSILSRFQQPTATNAPSSTQNGNSNSALSGGGLQGAKAVASSAQDTAGGDTFEGFLKKRKNDRKNKGDGPVPFVSSYRPADSMVSPAQPDTSPAPHTNTNKVKSKSKKPRWSPGKADDREASREASRGGSREASREASKYIAAAAAVGVQTSAASSNDQEARQSSSSSNPLTTERIDGLSIEERFDLPRDPALGTETGTGTGTVQDKRAAKNRNRKKKERKKNLRGQEQTYFQPTIANTANNNGRPPPPPPAPFIPGTRGPLIPYHDQAKLDFQTFKPRIPNYAALTSAREGGARSIPLPDISDQRGAFEQNNLKLHLCNGVFEAYSASYLTTRAHILNVDSQGYNLTWVNCEMASFIHMKESNGFFKKPDSEGVIMQSLDVLDFSVIHLSAYERSTRRYAHKLFKSQKDLKANWHKIEPVIEAGDKLAALNNPKSRTYRKINYSPEALNTIVIMPFLGGAMGAGHSKLGNRFEYLKTCFWSFYEFIPNIAAGVARQEDVDWGYKESGLPFYELLLLPTLPKSAGLPVGTMQQVKKKFQTGAWTFDYVFFTESDQILISRELQLMYHHLKTYPGHMLLPHRLMPYSKEIMEMVHMKNPQNVSHNAWMDQSCCIERQNCRNRKTWKFLREPEVAVINYYGLYVPLGNVNFLDEKYRTCKMQPYVGDYCP